MPSRRKLGAPEVYSRLLVNPGGTIDVGNDDWLWLAQSGVCLVDKSLLVRDFYECRSKVALVLRPRQFGKTLALNMLCTFFDVEYNWHPEPVSRDRRLEIFQKTRLGRQFPEFVETHCARYPVLFVSFRVRISRQRRLTFINFFSQNWAVATNGTDFIRLARQEMCLLYRQYRYLLSGLDGELIPQSDIDIFNRFLNNIDLGTSHLRIGLRFLVDLLSERHRSKCLVLIDDYDSPYHAAYQNGYLSTIQEVYAPMLSCVLMVS